MVHVSQTFRQCCALCTTCSDPNSNLQLCSDGGANIAINGHQWLPVLLEILIVSNSMPAAVSKAFFRDCVLFKPGRAFVCHISVHSHQRCTLQVISQSFIPSHCLIHSQDLQVHIWCVKRSTGAAVQISTPDVVVCSDAACQHTWSGFWTFTSLRVMEMNLPCEDGR